MSTTLRRCNIVYKTVSSLIVGVIMLHSNLNCNIIFHTFTVNNLLIERSFTLVQICYKFFNTTFIVEYMLMDLFLTKIS